MTARKACAEPRSEHCGRSHRALQIARFAGRAHVKRVLLGALRGERDLREYGLQELDRLYNSRPDGLWKFMS